MKLGIMQPYFFPYIGYFNLIASVDLFILYDNIKYTKKGWINRNRMLLNGKDVMFSLPLKNDSDYLPIDQRNLAPDFKVNELLNRIKGAYRNAPYFEQTMNLVEQVLKFDDANLFRFLHRAIIKICEYFDISTEIRISSDININHNLKNQEKVIALCLKVGASTYINPIGGVDLYSRNQFKERGIDLKFIQHKPFEYKQYGEAFVPCLSIIDSMMFNSFDIVQACIMNNYELI